MVLFSDGEDSEIMAGSRTATQIVQDAVSAKVPIFFVRTRFDRGLGSVVSDLQWKQAVEGTGGRFYAASNEATVFSGCWFGLPRWPKMRNRSAIVRLSPVQVLLLQLLETFGA